jgi:hypothetical protein
LEVVTGVGLVPGGTTTTNIRRTEDPLLTRD